MRLISMLDGFSPRGSAFAEGLAQWVRPASADHPFTSTAAFQRLMEPVRHAVRRWSHGEVVYFAPGEPWVLAEQPTFAPFRLVHHSPVDPPVQVGRYCSINETVTVMPSGEHHSDTISSFLFEYLTGEPIPEASASKGPIVIGNDVWIGREALLLSGVTIGDGAVIAARAVVTHDVSPYEVVGGVPARHLKWRFDEEARQALAEIAWWNWPVETVLAHRHQLGGTDLGQFIEAHRDQPGRGRCPICDAPGA